MVAGNSSKGVLIFLSFVNSSNSDKDVIIQGSSEIELEEKVIFCGSSGISVDYV